MEPIERMNKAMLDMISTGKFEYEFQIMSNTVKIKVLDFGAHSEALKNCATYDLAVKSVLMQKEILKRALISINGDQLPNIEEAGIFLDRLPVILVEFLYQRYDEAKSIRDLKVRSIMEKLKNGSRSQTPEDTGNTANSSSPSGSETSSPSKAPETL